MQAVHAPSHFVSITWRHIRETDLRDCLEIPPGHLSPRIAGRTAAFQTWRRMLRDPFFVAVAFESDPPIKGHRLIAFGASAFVAASFVDAELSEPRPGTNDRLIARVSAGEPVLLTRSEIAQANATAGADVVILSGSWREDIMSPEESLETHIVLPLAFTEIHTGYRLHRILWETTTQHEIDFARQSGVYRPVRTCPEAGCELHLMTREIASAVPASLANAMFRFQEPMLGLRESDQALLAAALNGATDEELCDDLGLAMPAVKARWRSAFARIGAARPDLTADKTERSGRGLQKRHRVLAWIRNHPEELRPYAWNGRPGKGGPHRKVLP